MKGVRTCRSCYTSHRYSSEATKTMIMSCVTPLCPPVMSDAPWRRCVCLRDLPRRQMPSEGSACARGSLWEICSAPHASERLFVKVVRQCSAAPLMSTTPQEVEGAYERAECWLIAIWWHAEKRWMLHMSQDDYIILCGKILELKSLKKWLSEIFKIILPILKVTF